MTLLSKSTAMLRFSSENINTSEITNFLGQSPTASEHKGDKVYIDTDGNYRIAPIGSWRFSVQDHVPGNLNAQVSEMFSHMTDDLALWNSLSDCFNGNLFIGLFLKNINEGIMLSPETLSAIGDRGLKLDFDIYGSI